MWLNFLNVTFFILLTSVLRAKSEDVRVKKPGTLHNEAPAWEFTHSYSVIYFGIYHIINYTKAAKENLQSTMSR